MHDTTRRVLDVVDAIPAGSVRSYGAVARAAGIASPRTVGRILARYGGEVPWHRVVRADGTVAGHLASEQLARLRAEGVTIADGRVDLTGRTARPAR